MIYSMRVQPEVNESHILEGRQNNLFIFHMDEVDLKDNRKEMLLL